MVEKSSAAHHFSRKIPLRPPDKGYWAASVHSLAVVHFPSMVTGFTCKPLSAVKPAFCAFAVPMIVQANIAMHIVTAIGFFTCIVSPVVYGQDTRHVSLKRFSVEWR